MMWWNLWEASSRASWNPSSMKTLPWNWHHDLSTRVCSHNYWICPLKSGPIPGNFYVHKHISKNNLMGSNLVDLGEESTEARSGIFMSSFFRSLKESWSSPWSNKSIGGPWLPKNAVLKLLAFFGHFSGQQKSSWEIAPLHATLWAMASWFMLWSSKLFVAVAWLRLYRFFPQCAESTFAGKHLCFCGKATAKKRGEFVFHLTTQTTQLSTLSSLLSFGLSGGCVRIWSSVRLPGSSVRKDSSVVRTTWSNELGPLPVSPVLTAQHAGLSEIWWTGERQKYGEMMQI